MTQEKWKRQAARLQAAWPATPMDDDRKAIYFEVLQDLDDEKVEAAVTALLKEDRPGLPPPGVIRRVAEADPGTAARAEPSSADAASSSKAEADAREREGRRPWLGVLFGILGIFPVALWLGLKSLRDRKRAQADGRAYEGLGAAISAIILGTVSALLLAVVLVAYLGEGDQSSPAPVGAASGASEPDTGGDSDLSPEGEVERGEPFRDGNFGFRVVSVRQVPRIEAITPARQAALVRVELDTVNLSSQPINGPICAPGYKGMVLVDVESRNYSADLSSATLSTSAPDPYCASAVQPGIERKIVLAFQIPEVAAPSIGGVAVWDPTEPGDEDGRGSYYFVHARL